MTTLLNYLNDSSLNIAEHQSFSNDSRAASLQQLNSMAIQPHACSQVDQSLLSKRPNSMDLGDLITKKLKTQSTDLSRSTSLQESPLSKSQQGMDSNTLSKSFVANEGQSMAIEEGSDDELGFDKKFGKTNIVIPPFEADTQYSLHGTESVAGSLKDSSVSVDRATQENSERLTEALEVLRMRFAAQDEATVFRDAILKLFLAQEPVKIPPFVEMSLIGGDASNKKEEKNENKKNDNQCDVLYGDVEYPFLSYSVPFGESQDDLKLELPKLVASRSKLSKQHSALSVPSKLSTAVSSMTEDDKTVLDSVKANIKESLEATRTGTIRSESDAGSIMNKVKKEKKAIRITHKDADSRKTNVKTADGFKKVTDKVKEKVKKPQDEPSEKVYSFSMKQKKSRSERQRSRWECAQDGNFTIGDYLTHVAQIGDQKKAEIPLGIDYQVDVSSIPFKQDTGRRRSLKMKWNPSSQNQNKLKTILKSLKTCLKTDVSQERGINLLIQNDSNVKKALSYAKDNKAKVLASLN